MVCVRVCVYFSGVFQGHFNVPELKAFIAAAMKGCADPYFHEHTHTLTCTFVPLSPWGHLIDIMHSLGPYSNRNPHNYMPKFNRNWIVN